MALNTKIKKYILKLSFLLIIFSIIGILFLNFTSNNAKKIINANIEIETLRLQNAIKEYRIKVGSYPDLLGNENELSKVKDVVTPGKDKYNFSLFYGSEKLYEIPENLEKGVEQSNKIVIAKDNKGGWFYNVLTGEIKVNIEEKNNKSTK